MKKKLFAFIPCLVLSLVCFNSCQKVESSINKIDEFNRLTQNYVSQVDKSDFKRKPRWLKILGADLKGALAGAGTGAGIGVAIGSGGGPGGAAAGATTGAVIGGVIGGAGASLEAAYETAPNSEPPKQKTSDEYNPSNNDTNPFDNIGRNHYKILNSSLSSTDNYSIHGEFSRELFYNYAKEEMSTITSSSTVSDFFPLTSNEDVLQTVKDDELNSISYFLTKYENDYITENVESVLLSYFDALEETEDVDAFVSYSISAEEIIATSTLSDIEKQIILGTMSTARYGIQYWGLI